MNWRITIFLFFFLLFNCAIQQYQQCSHLSGFGETTEPKFGEKMGIYDEANHIGGVSGATSFLLNSNGNSEILICYGETRFAISDRIWKFSISKRQWQFVKGRKDDDTPSVLNSPLNKFDKDIEIGSRRNVKGWKSGLEDDIVMFFGGFGTSNTIPTHLNEIWSFNLSSNAYSIFQCNDCQGAVSLFSNFTVGVNEFETATIPRAREEHEIIVINDKEVFLYGGIGYSRFNSGCSLSDWYIFSIELMQWKFIGGELQSYEISLPPYIAVLNKYHPDNSIGSLYSTSGIKINEEEIFIFGGKGPQGSQNSIFKYNITSTYWKLVKSSTENFFGTGYLRSFDSQNHPGIRKSHKILKLKKKKLLLFGGLGNTQYKEDGLLNDEWRYDIIQNLWSFTGKEKSKYANKEQIIDNNGKSYSENTLMGGIMSFVAEYNEDTKELFVCNGKGINIYGNSAKLNDVWRVYYGNMCFLLEDNDPLVCSGKGICANYNTCQCQDGYYGLECELSKCNGIFSNETELVCSGKGICYQSKCLCYFSSQYNKDDCTIDDKKQKLDEQYQLFIKNLWIIILVPVVIVFLLIIFIISSIFLCLIFCKQKEKLKKFDQIEDIDIILEEQKISKDTSIAHFRINQKMFEIESKDIEIIDKIGQGGSSAVVYLAMWNNQKVAYKCFIVQEFLEENKFKEFEKEVELLSSISFPKDVFTTMEENRMVIFQIF